MPKTLFNTVLKVRSALLAFCLIFFTVCFSTASAQQRYVTDDFEIMLRTGPGIGNKIIKALPSGTPLSVVILDAGRGHSQVRLKDGTVGFVLTRFVANTPASKYRVEALEKQLAELKSDPKGLQSKLLNLQESYDKLSQNFQKTVDARDSANNALERIKLASSDAVRLSEKNNSLENENRQLILQLDDLRIQNESIKDQSDKKWFALGAGTILLGLFLGYVLSRFKGRRRVNW